MKFQALSGCKNDIKYKSGQIDKILYCYLYFALVCATKQEYRLVLNANVFKQLWSRLKFENDANKQFVEIRLFCPKNADAANYNNTHLDKF